MDDIFYCPKCTSLNVVRGWDDYEEETFVDGQVACGDFDNKRTNAYDLQADVSLYECQDCGAHFAIMEV